MFEEALGEWASGGASLDNDDVAVKMVAMCAKPAVSVLLPVFNGGRLLAPAVESILRQVFSDFELLIIDDGSTDDSLRTIQALASRDTRIRWWTRRNLGLVPTLNELIGYARGELLARMDADDIAMPDRLARQVAYLDEHPEVVCLGGSFALIDLKSRFLTVLQAPTEDAEIQRLMLAGHSAICHPTVTLRRAAVTAVGGYNAEALHCEDLDLFLRLGERGKLANLDQVVLRYRVHEGSISGRNHKAQIESMRRVCELAWQRRGINGQFEATGWRPQGGRDQRAHFRLQHGWWAWNSAERKTALCYGLSAALASPLSLEPYRLIACALIKRPRDLRRGGRDGADRPRASDPGR